MYLAVFKSFPIILVFDALSCISQGSLHFLRRHLENFRGLHSSWPTTLCRKSQNISWILTAGSVLEDTFPVRSVAPRLLVFLFACLWTLNASWSINMQQKNLAHTQTILTSPLINKPYFSPSFHIFWGRRWSPGKKVNMNLRDNRGRIHDAKRSGHSKWGRPRKTKTNKSTCGHL